MSQKRIQRRLRARFPRQRLNLRRIARFCGRTFVFAGLAAIVAMLAITLAG